MNRRDFLKVAGLASLALFVKVSPSAGKLIDFQPQAESSGKLYRGTLDGKIFKSEDRGRSWNLHTNFGNQISVLGFSAKPGGQIVAHLLFQYRRFDIQLAKNGKFWMTAPAAV